MDECIYLLFLDRYAQEASVMFLSLHLSDMLLWQTCVLERVEINLLGSYQS